MSQTWDIDPKKGDYVMDKGAPVETDRLTVPAYFRLKTKRTRWLYAPDQAYGSDFYAVLRRPSLNAGEVLEGIAIDALQPLLDDNRASEIEVSADEFTRFGAGLNVKITDASGEADTLNFPGIGV
jgi:phage gp46-like protein